MKMVDKQQIWDRLARHFAGHDSEKEKNELQEWLVNASEDEKKIYDQVKSLWEKSSLEKSSFSPDVNQGWQRLQMKIKMRDNNGQKKIPYIKIAAAGLLLVLFSFLLLRYYDSQPEMIEFVAVDEVESVVLPDGSKVWLNQNAKLSYSDDYNIDNRKVFLEGEAFFEVEKAEGKRFSVLTEETITEVIGTSFNLRAVKDEPVVVQVATGKVAFASRKDQEAVFLEPGEKGVYSKQQEDSVVTEAIEDPNFRYWQNKKLTFSNSSLEQLSKTLEKNFDTTIIISEGLENCRFTGSFDQPSLEQVLDVLKITGNLEVDKTTNGYTVKGEGCN